MWHTESFRKNWQKSRGSKAESEKEKRRKDQQGRGRKLSRKQECGQVRGWVLKEDGGTGPDHVLQGGGSGQKSELTTRVRQAGVSRDWWSPVFCSLPALSCTACHHPRGYVMFTGIKGPEDSYRQLKSKRWEWSIGVEPLLWHGYLFWDSVSLKDAN